jgi:NAD(P) transhydrogenase subunit beta
MKAMSNTVYYVICILLAGGVLAGISMMSRVATAARGNRLSAVCTAIAIIVTLYKNALLSDIGLWAAMAVGLVIGLIAAAKVKMIEMPQAVALLNGFGGAASALVAMVSLLEKQIDGTFALLTAGLALVIGVITLLGSLIAAGKLHRLINQRPVVWPAHSAITALSLIASLLIVALGGFGLISPALIVAFGFLASAMFGIAFAIRVGGADMPITISLLNSLSGVAGAIAGMAISDPLLVAIGGIVGASGLILTQIMCRAMNRKLADILFGKAAKPSKAAATAPAAEPVKEEAAEPVREEAAAEPVPEDAAKEVTAEETPAEEAKPTTDLASIMKEAKKLIIVPGYGMALAQAQNLVKQLADKFEANGCEVKYGIHPVAGRMPGHMNVLLAEADVDYEQLYEMERINPEFDGCDLVVVIGANDVVNPAANTAEGTPIYGMPVLEIDKAKHIVFCNYDLKPGYAGVDNPLYKKESGVTLMLGDAKDTLKQLIEMI